MTGEDLTQTHSTTLQTIADKAGVSMTTVSNVLNRNRIGERSDAQRNARRIRAIADRLGYRPNTAARAIQTNRFHAIGLIASTEPRRSVYQPYLGGLTRACRRKDLHLTLGEVVDEKLADERYIPKVLREWAVDGLLIAYMLEFPPMLAQLIEQYRIPSVWLNAKQDHDCVYPDDLGGMKQATRRLIDMGHRRIAFLATYPEGHHSSTDRRRGYARAMLDAGLQPRVLYPDLTENVFLSTVLDDLSAWFRRDDRPTALVCNGDTPAMTAYHAALHAGLKVPRDLSIVGVYHQPIVGIGRNITTLQLPTAQVGLEAVEMLTRKIARPNEPIAPVAVPLTLENFDDSTAPPLEAGAG